MDAVHQKIPRYKPFTKNFSQIESNDLICSRAIFRSDSDPLKCLKSRQALKN